MTTHVQKVPKKTKTQKKKEILQSLCEKINLEKGFTPSLNEAIIFAAESFLNDLRLSTKQQKQLAEAASASKMTSQQILDKSCDWAYRFYCHKYSSASEPSSAEFSAGSAYQRIHEFVLKLMKKNDQCKKKEDKVFINQSYISKHQGSNRQAIKGHLAIHKELIDKHHKKHDLSPRHNVEVHSYLLRRSPVKNSK